MPFRAKCESGVKPPALQSRPFGRHHTADRYPTTIYWAHLGQVDIPFDLFVIESQPSVDYEWIDYELCQESVER